MKSFSRIPDPFQEQYDTVAIQFPLQKKFQINSVPQGKIQRQRVHIITNPNQVLQINKQLDKVKKKVLEISKESQHTTISELNNTSKLAQVKQKIKQAENVVQQKQNINQRFISCKQVFMLSGTEQIIDKSPIKKLDSKQLQQIQQSQVYLIQQKPYKINQQNHKGQLSHIVFSPSKQIINTFIHKKPIFPKQLPLNSFQKQQFKQLVISQVKKQNEINHRLIENLDDFVDSNQPYVQEHIQCSFFGNTVKDSSHKVMDNTRSHINDSNFIVKNFNKNQPTQYKAQIYHQTTDNKSQIKEIYELYEQNRRRIKRLGGSKISKAKKSISQLIKLKLTKNVNINPVFI